MKTLRENYAQFADDAVAPEKRFAAAAQAGPHRLALSTINFEP
jgi:hypothetical protein